LKNGYFEQLAVKICVKFADNSTILDVGSNIGTFSIPVALNFPKAKIISIEPQRNVYFHFCSNILVNKLQNIYPFNIAIGKTNKKNVSIKVPLLDSFTEKYTGSVSLDPKIHELRKKLIGIAEPSLYAKNFEDVPLKNLDEIAGTDRICFIKIDVEGMEHSVMRSAEKVLKKFKPFLYFEAWNFEEFKLEKNKLTKLCKKMGYELIRIGEDYFAFHPEIINEEKVLLKFAEIGLVVN
jgi:FkbM family methyltransferase